MKERGLLNMGYGPVLFLCLFGVVTLGVFFYSLVNISKRSAMKDERLIDKKTMQYIKKELKLSSFSIYTRNKAGNARTIAPFYGIGGDINMNIFSLLNGP